MTLPSIESIEKRLVEDGYPPAKVAPTAARLSGVTEPLHGAIATWVDEGTILNVEFAGFTAHSLISEHRMKPAAMFLTLDWLIRDPEEATKAVRAGYDRIGRSGQ